MSIVPNRPTPEGIALGAELARLCTSEIGDGPDGRCKSCAFRAGTVPNGCVPTLMDALKCIAQHETFYCHERESVCAGWLLCSEAATDSPGTEVPWEFSPSVDLRDVAAYRQDQAGQRETGVLEL